MMMMITTNKDQISDRIYFRIGDVAELVGVKPYVLRFWESEFTMISPQKSASGQRVYRQTDVETVLMIKRLLYDERYSIEGARKKIKELRKEGALDEFKEETATALKADGVSSKSSATNKSVSETPFSDTIHLKSSTGPSPASTTAMESAQATALSISTLAPSPVDTAETLAAAAVVVATPAQARLIDPEVKKLASELKELARTPISQLFAY